MKKSDSRIWGPKNYFAQNVTPIFFPSCHPTHKESSLIFLHCFFFFFFKYPFSLLLQNPSLAASQCLTSASLPLWDFPPPPLSLNSTTSIFLSSPVCTFVYHTAQRVERYSLTFAFFWREIGDHELKMMTNVLPFHTYKQI